MVVADVSLDRGLRYLCGIPNPLHTEPVCGSQQEQGQYIIQASDDESQEEKTRYYTSLTWVVSLPPFYYANRPAAGRFFYSCETLYSNG